MDSKKILKQLDERRLLEATKAAVAAGCLFYNEEEDVYCQTGSGDIKEAYRFAQQKVRIAFDNEQEANSWVDKVINEALSEC